MTATTTEQDAVPTTAAELQAQLNAIAEQRADLDTFLANLKRDRAAAEASLGEAIADLASPEEIARLKKQLRDLSGEEAGHQHAQEILTQREAALRDALADRKIEEAEAAAKASRDEVRALLAELDAIVRRIVPEVDELATVIDATGAQINEAHIAKQAAIQMRTPGPNAWDAIPPYDGWQAPQLRKLVTALIEYSRGGLR